jgi:hypothetical protein
MDTSELKEIAAAATQGIWVDQQHGRAVTVGNATLCEVFSGSVGIEEADANGRFIAAFCPEVALALLAEIERLATQVRLAGVAAEATVHQAVGRAATETLLIMHERDQLKVENEALRKALTDIRENSSDLGACECAADALMDSRRQ